MEHTPEPGVAGTFALHAPDVPLDPGELDPSQVIDGRTTWTVHEPLRKVFQITLADGEPSSGRA